MSDQARLWNILPEEIGQAESVSYRTAFDLTLFSFWL